MRGSPRSCACPPFSGTRRCGRPCERCSPGASTTLSVSAPRREQAGPARRRPQRDAVRAAWCASAPSSNVRRSTRSTSAFVEDKIANSSAGVAYRGSYAWVLAGRGETERARNELCAVMALRTRSTRTGSPSRQSAPRRASWWTTPLMPPLSTSGCCPTRAGRSPPAAASAATARSTVVLGGLARVARATR